jgi:rhodanese-related sulfurtransferase
MSGRKSKQARREQEGRHRTKAVPKSIDHDEVQRLIAEENAQLVEVLPALEFGEEHITGATNIPLKELDERAPVELDRGRPVIVYCNDYQ